MDVDGFDGYFCGKSQDFRLSLSEKKSVRCRWSWPPFPFLLLLLSGLLQAKKFFAFQCAWIHKKDQWLCNYLPVTDWWGLQNSWGLGWNRERFSPMDLHAFSTGGHWSSRRLWCRAAHEACLLLGKDGHLEIQETTEANWNSIRLHLVTTVGHPLLGYLVLWLWTMIGWSSRIAGLLILSLTRSTSKAFSNLRRLLGFQLC